MKIQPGKVVKNKMKKKTRKIKIQESKNKIAKSKYNIKHRKQLKGKISENSPLPEYRIETKTINGNIIRIKKLKGGSK